MLVFLDFEASSLGKKSYPIEVGWVFEDGREEAHLIRPAPDWIDWDDEAAAIHNITREMLVGEGTSHVVVAERMASELGGHRLCASAPSWDGKWLSALLRAGGRPRHELRLEKTDDVQAETARSMLLARGVVPNEIAGLTAEILAAARAEAEQRVPRHRALEDARQELATWREVRRLAEAAELL
ncbi:hypothetical protein SAMN05216548_108170 [Faunimonas pinastri]|uniref:Uncharacterized protein n=1 Tax=Faunimonas pinastri TaxID=1855383 RepID=A0A1H9JL93_9HYPH|nr:transcriptional regulator [Faunimonas pinastri]SEQ87632.1 hypothetical protein SAMN05216548_108170 [Faunimonas pinastri]